MATGNVCNIILAACRNNNLNDIIQCRQRNFDLHFETEYPLQIACQYGNMDIVKFLVEDGANIHADNELAFRWSCSHGKLEIVKYLLESTNYTINLYAETCNAMRYVCINNHFEIFKFLLDIGFKIDYSDYGIICWAADEGNLEMLKHISQFNLPNLSRLSIRFAIDKGHVSCCIYLNHKFGIEIDYHKYNTMFTLFYSILCHFYFSNTWKLKDSEYDPMHDYLWDANIGLIVCQYCW